MDSCLFDTKPLLEPKHFMSHPDLNISLTHDFMLSAISVAIVNASS